MKIVIGKIQTHALQLHTPKMQTLEMVKKHGHLNNKKKVFFRDNSIPQRARVCGIKGDCKLKEVTGLSSSPVLLRF